MSLKNQEHPIQLHEDQLTTDTTDWEMTKKTLAEDTAAFANTTQDCLVCQTKVADFEANNKSQSEELEVLAKAKDAISEKTGDAEYRDIRSMLSSHGSLVISLSKSEHSIELAQISCCLDFTMHAETSNGDDCFRMKQCQEISDTQNTSRRPAMSGGTPSTPDKSQRGDVRELANARQQETEIMRVHRRLQAKKAERCNTGAASRDFAQARFSTKLHASTLQRPPVSMATTTNLHLRPSTSSEYFLSLSRRAALATAPSNTAAFGQALQSDGQLRSMFERQTGSEDFYLPFIVGRDGHIHVSKLDVAPNHSACFPCAPKFSPAPLHENANDPTVDMLHGAFPNCQRNLRTRSELLQCPMGAVVVRRSLCGRLVVTT